MKIYFLIRPENNFVRLLHEYFPSHSLQKLNYGKYVESLSIALMEYKS